jgi:anti-sigma factor ChrR (cupin superfamily)
MSSSAKHDRGHVERVSLYALQALPAGESPAVEAQIAACSECREELDALQPVIASFVSWPTDVLRPPATLWDRLARRIAAETGQEPVSPAPRRPAEAKWEDVAPGISVKLLATDAENHRVSMLVRLAPGTDYPPHRHGGIEELHLLDGELMIDDRKLRPGDYSRAEAGGVDRRVWSETGCTCVLITSAKDILL